MLTALFNMYIYDTENRYINMQNCVKLCNICTILGLYIYKYTHSYSSSMLDKLSMVDS